jgi:hypothetical protein
VAGGGANNNGWWDKTNSALMASGNQTGLRSLRAWFSNPYFSQQTREMGHPR